MHDIDYILIAEDDEDDQLLMKSAFRDISAVFNIRFVSNGLELLDHFRRYDEGLEKYLPHLLILDLNMPRKNGREALEELRHKPYFKTFPTIIFSTTGNEFEKSRCRELGVPAYFVKPVSYTSLTKVVEHFNRVATMSKES